MPETEYLTNDEMIILDRAFALIGAERLSGSLNEITSEKWCKTRTEPVRALYWKILTQFNAS